MKPERLHIGDGVYISNDDYHFIIETYDGINVTNRIYLDRHVQIALLKFLKRILGKDGE